MRTRLRLFALALVSPAAACSSPSADPVVVLADEPPVASLPAAGAGAPSAPPSGLPGDEALTPPPADPAGPSLLAELDQLSVGDLHGDIDLVASGLVGFDEGVHGRCTETSIGRGFEITLSDGSELHLEFRADGGTAGLSAPGISLDQTMTDVDVSTGAVFILTADLLTGGTTERSGHLVLSGRCS